MRLLQKEPAHPLSFSCNLRVEAKKHIVFLRDLHQLGVTSAVIQSSSGAEAAAGRFDLSLRRYALLWLPLVASTVTASHHTGDGKRQYHPLLLIPPADIAWLWHCHRLAPYEYERFCIQRFGRILDPNPSFSFQSSTHSSCHQEQNQHDEHGEVKRSGNTSRKYKIDGDVNESNNNIFSSALSRTRELWSKLYPREPFFASFEKTNVSNRSAGTNASYGKKEVTKHKDKGDQNIILDGFDLRGSAERQATFLWQVSAAPYENDDFLDEGVRNYKRFLELGARRTDVLAKDCADGSRANKSSTHRFPLVPTYQIDLMWHTHMLYSINAYNRDCVRIRGSRFHHDDSLNDRSPGAKLDISFRETEALWKATYGLEYVVEGGMYRGEPPPLYYVGKDCIALLGVVEDHTTLDVRTQFMQGSFSSGTEVTAPWRDPQDQSTYPLAFFQAEPTRRDWQRANLYPARENYIFGKGKAGLGYYSYETRDACDIMSLRLQIQYHALCRQYDLYDCVNCLCFGCKPTAAQVREKDRILGDLEHLKEQLDYLTLKRAAAGPHVEIPYPPERKYEPLRQHQNPGSIMTGINDPTTLPTRPARSLQDLCNAAGCGGGREAGGCGGRPIGSGGGGCGGGCGGGGCGGGGCGGGGCGGGGCGGGG